MSSHAKGLGLGLLIGLGIAGVLLPCHVEVTGSFGAAPGARPAGFTWALLVGLKPPFFPAPVWLRFPQDSKKRFPPAVTRQPCPDAGHRGASRPGAGRTNPENLRRYALQILSELRYFLRRFEVSDLKARLEVGLADAASTALVAGGLLVLVRTVLPLLMPLRRGRLQRDVKIVPVYDRAALNGHFMVKGQIKTIHLLTAFTRMAFKVLKMRRSPAAHPGAEYPVSQGAR